MPRISVLLPTRDRALTLPYAVRSIQMQGVDDLEILIAGDGATDAVRRTVADLQRSDSRIRFFDLPKAPHRGELNRDHVMRQAQGELIFHQNDDDLWLPGHIAMFEQALADADFVGAMQINVNPDGSVRAFFFDLERSEYAEPWLAWIPNDFGPWANNGFPPVFAAHRRDAFLALSEGWVTTPPGLPADQVFWHRFARHGCRMRFLRWPVALQFYSGHRVGWSDERRAEELRRWTGVIERPDYAVHIWRKLLPELGDRLLQQALDERKARHDLVAAHQAVVADLESQIAGLRAERDQARAERLDEYGRRLAREKDLNDVLSSTSWRLTAPLRALLHRLKQRG